MNIHIELHAALVATESPHFSAPPRLTQDALELFLADGTTMQVRYAARDAYSFRWQSAGLTGGIDTAPLHRHLSSWPNHLHLADGSAVADPLTRIDAEPLHNLLAVIGSLLAARPPIQPR
ncbi:MAG: hypothetical protein Q8Q80_07800 [Methyloversatilis sp.]|uniref:hypothetical protein n=1 Tax=Methyloversatilis sp. TaxID=2569862 RepID=UPI00273428A2|nr:hypothetical protein [Methyloversatilis sp.]MDP3872551.1 hypothetical protein [Methyloversatilis sp.]